jgi:ParB family chromosome partitioning protein
MSKPALGRGLGALLGSFPVTAKPAVDVVAPVTSTETAPVSPGREPVQEVPLSQIHPCPLQPRKQFPAESLQELADSIRENGIVQPLIVRRGADGLELIAGERRWRAAQMAALASVPVIVRQADDRTVLELALIENLQRENLNPMEEAQGYAQLVEQFELTQEDVAKRVGKSRAAVANALRLLRLDPEVQGLIREGRLSVGHAKVILGLPDPARQKQAAERIVKEALNVRQTEGLVARLQHPATRPSKPSLIPQTDAHVVHLEGRIRERVGTKVRLSYKAGKGSVEICFFSDDELERILQLLGVEPS